MGEVKELEVKILATLGMLALTIIFCYLPWFVHRKWRKATWLISLLNCLAGGVVLGALLMHMIPEMVVPHKDGSCDGFYQWGCLASGISFLVLFSVDRLFLSHAHCENENVDAKADHHIDGHDSHHHHHHHHHGEANDKHDALEIPHIHHHHHDGHEGHTHDHAHSCQSSSIESFHPHEDCHEADIMGGCHMEGIRTSKSKLQTYVFVFCLSLHSLLEGLGVSGKNHRSDLFKFLTGLFAHKWIEAFALGVTVMGARFSRMESFLLMGFYALLTPVGIALGMLVDWKFSNGGNSGRAMSEYILNGASAGSFLFVSCIEMIPPEFHTKNQSTPAKFMAIVAGFLVMAGVATYHHH
jgi:zinc transporter ZupT